MNLTNVKVSETSLNANSGLTLKLIGSNRLVWHQSLKALPDLLELFEVRNWDQIKGKYARINPSTLVLFNIMDDKNYVENS